MGRVHDVPKQSWFKYPVHVLIQKTNKQTKPVSIYVKSGFVKIPTILLIALQTTFSFFLSLFQQVGRAGKEANDRNSFDNYKKKKRKKQMLIKR